MTASAATLAPLTSRLCLAHHWLNHRHVKAPLADPLIDAHLDGGYPVGACPITPGSSTTQCAVLDMDSHKGDVAWGAMLDTARQVIEALEESHLHAIPFRSSGGSGIHLIMLWREPQDAYSVREALRIALGKCGLKSGVGGIAKGEVEVFPKQDSVPADGFGSMFVLPLHNKSRALLAGTLDDTVPSLIEWRASDPVTPREKPDVPQPSTTASVEGDLAVVKAALDAIPNSGAQELDYDAWRNIIFALHSATDGGDDGLALAHEFSARSTKYDPDFLDTRVWPYVRTERDNAITVRTLYAAAAGHGWTDPTVIDAFPVSAPGSNDPFTLTPMAEGSTSAGATRFKALTIAEFTAGKSPPWLIKNVLPQAALGVIYGESTSGKTFFALDVTGSIAQGEPWRDNRVQQGRVAYICAEGVNGFRNRVRAYLEHHKLTDLDLRVIPDAPNFMKTDDIVAVLESLREAGPVSVVVVDTFAQVMPGANENAGEDVGKAIYHCQQIHRQTGALVLLIHHSGKDASKGARGWSGLRAAADVEIEITRVEHDRVATVTKLKDGEDGTEFGFKLQTVPVGADDDGDVVTSCVIEYTQALPKSQRAKVKAPGQREQAVLDAFDALEMTEDVVTEEQIKQRVSELTNRRRNSVQGSIDSLVDRGFLIRVGVGVERVGA